MHAYTLAQPSCMTTHTYSISGNFCRYFTATPHCGQIFLEPTGEIKSPGFDLNIPYLPNSDCTWKISTDVNRTIALGLVDNTFDVEEGASMFVCNHDYLTVYDADNEDQDKSRGRFCGDAFGMRAFRTLYSSGRHLYLTFKSNDKNQRKGFHLQYRTFLKGEVVKRLGIYSTSNGHALILAAYEIPRASIRYVAAQSNAELTFNEFMWVVAVYNANCMFVLLH